MSQDNRRTGNKNYDILEVTDHQKEIVRRLAVGQDPETIARDLNLTMQTISNVRNHPIIVEMIAALHDSRNDSTKDITEQIAEVAPDCIKLLKQVVRNETLGEDSQMSTDPEVADQIRASLGLLKVITPRLNIHAHKHLITNNTVEKIKQRALEGAKKVEEDDYEVVDENVPVS